MLPEVAIDQRRTQHLIFTDIHRIERAEIYTY